MNAKERLNIFKKNTDKLNELKEEQNKFTELSDDDLDLVTGGSELQPRIVEVD